MFFNALYAYISISTQHFAYYAKWLQQKYRHTFVERNVKKIELVAQEFYLGKAHKSRHLPIDFNQLSISINRLSICNQWINYRSICKIGINYL